MTTQEASVKINEIVEKIAKNYKPDKIFLFGSFAWGNPKPNSDIDLLIVKSTKNTRNLAMKIDGSLFPRSLPIDLIVYTPSQIKKEVNLEDPFILKIVNKGKILFTNK
mgnify:CR=1 FL=1